MIINIRKNYQKIERKKEIYRESKKQNKRKRDKEKDRIEMELEIEREKWEIKCL